MRIADTLLPEFDREMANTRKALERVPEDKFAWKPHAKSGSLGWLAGHVSNIPSWPSWVVGQDELDLEPGGKQMTPPAAPANRKELLASFDKNVQQGREAIASAANEQLMQPWSLKRNGKTLMTLPKAAVLRGFVMNHHIHHRAQLGVYLRLLDVPVPAIYGPSADEAGF
jgi:uncharacterized damage-inducible protein DinB